MLHLVFAAQNRAVSTDRGRSWSKPINIDRGSGAYPSMVELSDGRVLCVYYVEERPGSKIRQAVFQVKAGPKLVFTE